MISSFNRRRIDMNRFHLCAAILAVAAISVSCEKQPDEGSVSDKQISFSLGHKATKADEKTPDIRTAIIPLDADNASGMHYFLEETVTVLDDFCAPMTKGTPIYTENVHTSLSSFTATGYKFDNDVLTTPAYLADAAFNYYEDKWVHDYPSSPWKEDINSLWFFMRNDAKIAITPSLTTVGKKVYGKMTFEYTSPATAAAQKDIVFAARSVTKEEAKEAKVLFYHALTAVKFRIANDANAMINSVKFTGLKNTGTCTVTPYYGSGWENESNPFESALANSKSADCVVWDASGNGTFTQSFDGIVDFEEPVSGDKPFADSFYAAAADNNLNDEDASLTFWFIPQQLSASVKLEVNYTAAGKTKTVTIDFGDLAKGTFSKYPTWGAGELRTYTLKANEAGITIEDEVEDNVKKNIEITNTGSIDEYVRVAVIANWVNSDGNVVAPCTPALTLNDGWSLNHNDGLYYFSDAIAPNDTATAPFDSYTPPTKPAGADHLVMDIAVQAIEKGDKSSYTAAWAAAAKVTF